MGVVLFLCVYGFFFFKQKTAYEMRISDWSSDVCSSDLPRADHQRYEVITEAAKQECGEQVDDHDHAMHRNKLQVVFRLNPRNRTGKPELEQIGRAQV